ncbi:zeta toxin family protein [Methylomicrobium lacus]|uniref:zeta toxin family protein n=1 Tax=Methylomicrobium lacus TaxID=136992 RepID=UPI00045E85F5|nr:zeta toxin family protein [Methylomicrobium lacus]
MNENQNPKPRLLVIAGPNGAGKTTITEQGLAHEWFQGCEYINPDFIARDEFGDWNSHKAVINAANLAAERREQCLQDRRSLAFETVFSGPDKVEFLQKARSRGYFIRVFFVATSDPSINAARVARRVMLGGHDVPIPKIISRFFRSIAQCAVIAPWVDRLYLYDNSVDGQEPQLVLRANEGCIVKSYQTAPFWMSPIIAALQK